MMLKNFGKHNNKLCKNCHTDSKYLVVGIMGLVNKRYICRCSNCHKIYFLYEEGCNNNEEVKDNI